MTKSNPERLLWTSAMVVLISFMSIAAEKKFERTFQVSAGGTLNLYTDAGSVTVTGSSSGQVSIVATIQGSRSDVDEFQIRADQTSQGVEVEGKGGRNLFGLFRSRSLDVRYEISVPNEYNLQLKTSGGEIDVSNLKGKVDGKTSGGDVAISNINGAVTLGTSGGNVRAENIQGDARCWTSGGNIHVKSVVGALDVKTSGGDISVDAVEGSVRSKTSGGNIRMKVVKENKGIHAETSGGNITLILPKDIAATIDASTSGGSVSCDLPVTVSGKMVTSKLRGTVNGGGNQIYCHTSGGDVTIRSN